VVDEIDILTWAAVVYRLLLRSTAVREHFQTRGHKLQAKFKHLKKAHPDSSNDVTVNESKTEDNRRKALTRVRHFHIFQNLWHT
jgi:hypothetical protein